VDSENARRVGATFEAMLVAQVLKPLTKSCDMLGDYGSSALAMDIAQRDRNGFGALLARQLDASHAHR